MDNLDECSDENAVQFVQPRLTRITVNLTDRTVRALAEVLTLTGETKTEIINQALRMYAYITTMSETGAELLIRENETLERIKFL